MQYGEPDPEYAAEKVRERGYDLDETTHYDHYLGRR